MKILGIHDGHNSSVCLMEDGKILFAAQEERFTRKKNQTGMPANCMNIVKEKYGNPDKIALGSFIVAKPDTIQLMSKFSKETILEKIKRKLPFKHQLKESYNILSGFYISNADKRLSKIEAVFENADVTAYDHHLCHAATAYYGSGFDECLVFTVNGWGDDKSSGVYHCKSGDISLLDKTTDISMGSIYACITRYLGMKPWEHEFKVMGLAPYAKHIEDAYNVLSKLIQVEDTHFVKGLDVKIYPYLHNNLEGMRFDSIAGAMQQLLENRVLELIENAVKKYGPLKIACAGGCFMNVKLNMLLKNKYGNENVFIFPSCADESISIGAAYLASEKREPYGSGYYGMDYGINLDISKEYSVLKFDNIEEEIALLLSEGEIVARYNGRSEFGQRALGNRSILANPSDENVKKIINEMIKSRDWFMPFAPSILEEDMHKYLNNAEFAPWMITAFNTKIQAPLKAAIHPYDETARPQIVRESWNSSYHKILTEFKKLTGEGVLLNTSFNIHGFPIVETPEDALYVFKNSGLKYLAIGNYLVTKND